MASAFLLVNLAVNPPDLGGRGSFSSRNPPRAIRQERELTKSLRMSLLRQARWGLIFSPICMSGRPQSKTSGQSKTVSSGHAWSFSSASRLRFDPTSLSEEKRLTLLAYVDFVGTRHCYSHPRQSARHGDLLPSIYGLKVRCMEASHGSEPLH